MNSRALLGASSKIRPVDSERRMSWRCRVLRFNAKGGADERSRPRISSGTTNRPDNQRRDAEERLAVPGPSRPAGAVLRHVRSRGWTGSIELRCRPTRLPHERPRAHRRLSGLRDGRGASCYRDWGLDRRTGKFASWCEWSTVPGKSDLGYASAGRPLLSLRGHEIGTDVFCASKSIF